MHTSFAALCGGGSGCYLTINNYYNYRIFLLCYISMYMSVYGREPCDGLAGKQQT